MDKKNSFIFFATTLFSFLALLSSPFNFSISTKTQSKEYLGAMAFLVIGTLIWFAANWLINELRSLNKKLHSLLEYSQRVNNFRSLGLLTSGICHELSTPLNTTLLKISSLSRSTEATSDRKKDLDIALSNLEKCSKSLKDLNQTIHHLDGDFSEETSDIKEVLNHTINEYRKSSSLEININKCPDSAIVKLPKLILIRSIIDIFDNAKEAGASRLDFNFNMSSNSDVLFIIVNDNGSGFNESIINELGSPFITTKQNGTGLGLYQLKNTIQYIGGSVIFDNVNSGSQIKLKVPMA